MPYDDNDLLVVQRLEADLEELKSLVEELNPENFAAVKRLGLPVFRKDLLQQFLGYVDGLYALNVLNQPEQALKKLAQSVMSPQMICHSTAKKTFILLTEILTGRLNKLREEAKKVIRQAPAQVSRFVRQPTID